ncbi:AraC family transcriptional regulator [Nostoc sp. CHAB 5784]|uniref:AraC family transcriptional regulator n=1 Tax=Nostoc mirabile TaxID=2907820 RepID=UPI001E60D871|nr:AraC family transcriptional regulator [Nostoc mirabile]MCC5668798.1 AraC family transcriptional regulator [Nostoc mirabile CHAB5784]
MAEAIETYDSMSELYASFGGKLEQDVDFTIHRNEELYPNFPIKSPLFRTSFYSVLILREGRGRYLVDDQSYVTRGNIIYFTNPGHLKGFEVEETLQGYIITFTEAFLKQYVHENILDEFPFLIAEVAPPSYPDREVFQIFDDLGGQLLQEYQSDSAYKYKVIGCLTVVLLLKIKEWFWKAYNPLTEASTSSNITLTFQRNLEAHFRDLLTGKCDRLFQVQDYAQAQYLHPNYFSTVIKYKTGKSVNSWIAEKIIAEAKAMLARSSESVQEIATRLGFKDAGHFSRFFKKHTELSPLSFRQSLQS